MLIPFLASLVTLQAQPALPYPVHLLGRPSAYTGFQIGLDSKHSFRLLLCDGGIIKASKATDEPYGVTLSGLRGPGVTFGKESSITVDCATIHSLGLLFRLDVRSFDKTLWQAAAGKAPFHFLCLSMPEAECWHQQGWLNATPLADPFPLLEDKHAGTPEISSYKFDRNWSNIVPLGAQAVPIIGLWSPSSRLYEGIDFQWTRNLDDTEHSICTAYHWGGPPTGSGGKPADQFVCLAYPYGGTGYQGLAYPTAPFTLRASADFLLSNDLGPEKDPNELCYRNAWRDGFGLSEAPDTVDLSWVPGGIRLKQFDPPASGLIVGPEHPFMTADATTISGWDWTRENPVLVAAKNHDEKALDGFRRVARDLRDKAQRFQAGGDSCLYWTKPLTGSWVDDWGGAEVKTLHNANGFAAGRLFLGLAEVDNKPEDWAMVQGVLNWAKHIGWTRDEFSDVPSSPFTIGGTLAIAFCLDCAQHFRTTGADECIELARSFAYRYMVMWMNDSDHFDNLDSSFLWEPNSGRDWTGAACANEVFANLDTLGEVAVETGDPILRWALQGSLSRFYQLYQEKYRPSILDYKAGDMDEGYGLYPGDVYGYGVHSAHGFSIPMHLIEPVGDANVRMLAGAGAAMAFGYNDAQVTIKDYRVSPSGGFSFKVQASAPDLTVTLTEPFKDIHDAEVVVNGQDHGAQVVRPADNPWSLQISGLKPGDEVGIGKLDSQMRSKPTGADKPRPDYAPETLYGCRPVPGDTPADKSWSHPQSFAGLPKGAIWVYGMPFLLADESATRPFDCSTKSDPMVDEETKPGDLCVLFSPGSTYPIVRLPNGKSVTIVPEECVLAWRAWPPIYSARLLAAKVPVPPNATVRIDPNGSSVWAVDTQVPPDPVRCQAAWQSGIQAYAELRKQDDLYASLSSFGASNPGSPIAILPTDFKGTISTAAARGQLDSHLRVVDGETLSAGVPSGTKVAVATSGEDYLATVHEKGDAGEAVAKFVRDGGTLVLAASGPFPMFYAQGPGGQTVDPLPPKLGLPISIPFPTMPAGGVTFKVNLDQKVLSLDVPSSFPMPDGDPRLRSIDPSQIPAGANYTSIVSAVGADGKSYGDAAGLLTLPGGGKILYVWCGLTLDPKLGDAFSIAVWKFALQVSR